MLSPFYLLISDSLSASIKGWFTGIDRGVHIVTSMEILSKEKQMIMSYNCISSSCSSVCCLASILGMGSSNPYEERRAT